MSLDPFDAVAVAEAVASGEPERFAAGVRALAEAVRQGDAYDVPLPDRAALPGLLASGDPDAAEALLSLLESYGAFLPPAMPDDLWAWGGRCWFASATSGWGCGWPSASGRRRTRPPPWGPC